MNRTVSQIMGAVGAVLLLSSGFTYFAADPALAIGKVVLGLILLVGFIVTSWKFMSQFATPRGTMFFFSSTAMMVALVIGLIAVNYIAFKKNKSWDFTEKKIYTLAPQTQSAVKELKEKVSAIAFIPPGEPAYEPLENMFRRYQEIAPDKFDYSFKDPRKNPDLAAKYKLQQGQATVVLTRGEGDKQTQTSLNIISEQELTNALLKLNSTGEQKVYFVVGHGEPTLNEVQDIQGQAPAQSVSELKQSLAQEGYTSEELNLAGKTEIPRDCAVLVIAGARTKFTDPEVKVVEQFLNTGGRLAYFAEVGADPGLDAVLNQYGVQVDNGIIADAKFASQSPYYVVSLFYAEHDIVRLLKLGQMNVLFPTARGLSVVHSGQAEGVKTDTVLTTSPYAWEETAPSENPQPDSGEKVGQIPLVLASTRPTSSAPNKRYDEARVVVFGDSEMLLNALWGHEGNRNLVLNGISWAANQVNKVTIRPPDRDISTIDIDDKTMGRIRFFAMDLAPFALLAVGLGVWISRKNK